MMGRMDRRDIQKLIYGQMKQLTNGWRGLQTNYCIDASVKSAFERGYKVIIPDGTNSTFDNDYMDGETTYKYYNEIMWPKRFTDCISLDEALGMMER